jgi:uncharacterized protein YbaP (TraB family)
MRFINSLARFSALLAFLLAAVAPAAAENTCPPEPGDPAAALQQAIASGDAPDRGFLWRISKDGRTSYLYGTLHVGKPDWIAPGPAMKRVLGEVDDLAVELDVTDQATMEKLQKLLEAPSRGALPAPLVARVRKLAKSMCLPYDSVAKLPPELQLTTLGVAAGRRESLEPMYAVDIVLAVLVHAIGKPVVALETPELQLRALILDSFQDTISLAQKGLDELENGQARDALVRLATDWADSNQDDMARYLQWCGCVETKAEKLQMKRTLDERNPGFAERIDALHASGRRVLAAVGSAHMFGPQGLPALMAARGYVVERVEPAR